MYETVVYVKLTVLYREFYKKLVENVVFYWKKEKVNLTQLIYNCKDMDRKEFENQVKTRIKTVYSWQHIFDKYMEVFGD